MTIRTTGFWDKRALAMYVDYHEGASLRSISTKYGHGVDQVRSAFIRYGYPLRDDPQYTGKPGSRAPRVISGLIGGNLARHQARTGPMVERARRALATGTYLLPAQREALELRVTHPGKTIAEIADLVGVTKDKYWGLLRRGMEQAEEMVA